MTSKSIRLAGLVGALALVACGHGPPMASYAPLPDGWTHLCEPKRFVVDFPEAPREGRLTLEGANGPLVAATWSAVHGRRVYVAEFVEFDDVLAPPEEIVARMRANAVHRGRVIDDRPRSGPGWASDDLIAEIPSETGTRMTQVRVVLSRHQLFILVTGAPNLDDDQGSAVRFLTSLRYRDAAMECD